MPEADPGGLPASRATAAPARLHALDACRAAAMLLGIALHAALAYRPDLGEGWPVDDTDAAWIAGGVELVHAFRMQLFFLLAGFFTTLLVERRGLRGLLRDRGLRIGVPYGIGVVVLSPLCMLAWSVAADELAWVTPEGLLAEVGGAWHLWFLRDLLVLYGLAALVTRLVPAPARAAVGSAVGRAALHPLGPLALAAVVFPTLLVQPWWGIHGTGALPRWENVLHYGTWFGLGAALWPLRSRLGELGRRWALWAAVGLLAAWPLHRLAAARFEAVGGWEIGSLAGEPLALGLATRAVYAVVGASLVAAFLGLFVRYLDRPSPAIRYVSDASYWAYLVHFPLVLMLARPLAAASLPPVAEIGISLALICPVLLASYALLVRHTVIGRVLHGPRARAPRSGGGAPPVTVEAA